MEIVYVCTIIAFLLFVEMAIDKNTDVLLEQNSILRRIKFDLEDYIRLLEEED